MEPLEAQLLQQTERSRDFFWHRIRWDAVRTYLPRDRAFDLLDVGAGAGMLGGFLQRDVPMATYRFIEPLASLERLLEHTYGTESNAKGLESFEGIPYIALLDVLEHQKDDRAFLHDLFERMDAGAILLMTVPAMPRLWSGWDVALGHHRRYDHRSLGRCLGAVPARILEVSYLFPELIPAAWARTLRRRESEGPPSEVGFPNLPHFLNETMYAIGSASMRLRRWWPVGTSLFAAIERT